MKKSFGLLHITWNGLAFWLGVVALFIWLLRTRNRQIKMSTISEFGKEVYIDLIEQGFSIQQAQFVTAQAAHETGNFTSELFLKYNNCFGYKYVGQSIALGETIQDFAIYNSIYDSVQDFTVYYSRNQFDKTFDTIRAYIEKLKEVNYFEDDKETYIKGVTYFYNLYFNVTAI
jgi:uncharacterized FlgJ-related protein